MNLTNVSVELRPGQGWAHLGIEVDPKVNDLEEHPAALALAQVLYQIGDRAPVAVVLTLLAVGAASGEDLFEEESEMLEGVESELLKALTDRKLPIDNPFSFYRLPTG